MTFGADSIVPKSLGFGELLETRYPMWVPRYQRAYAWHDDDIEKLIGDITELLTKPSGAVGHFFGGVVCIQHQDNTQTPPQTYEVVDGQQRVATIVLALACILQVTSEVAAKAVGNAAPAVLARSRATTLADSIRSKLLYWTKYDVVAGMQLECPRLTLSQQDDDVFQQLVRGEPPMLPPSARESHVLLVEAHGSLLQFVRDVAGSTGAIAKRIDRLDRLKSALAMDAHLIHIESKDRHQAYRLFSVLNHRGESLSDADLLRSRSLELLVGYPIEQERVAVVWDEMFTHPASRVEAFLRALYPSRQGKRASADRLFDETVEAFFPSAPPTTAAAATELVAVIEGFWGELETFAKLSNGQWPYARGPGIASTVRAWQVDRLKRLTVTLKHDLALPVLLAGAAVLPEKSFAELVYLIEIFAFRYKIICNGHATPPANAYYDAAKAIRNHTGPGAFSLNPLRTKLRALVAASAGDTLFKEMLVEKLRYSSPSQRGNIREFLTTIEDHDTWWKNGPAANARPRPSMSKVCDLEEATIEHIYPQNAQAAHVDPTLEPVKHLLGNLTFFGQDDNVAAANKPFAAKRSTNYANSSVTMTKDLAAIGTWDLATIANRETDLVARALRIFVI